MHDHSSHEHHGHAQIQPQPNVVVQTSKLAVQISERAAKELRTVMASEGVQSAGLRLGVEPGGCAGYQYALSFAESAQGDEVAAESQGVKVFVSRATIPMVNGLVIDYVETPMGAGFNIKNPNAKSTCGCGNTFDA